MSNEFDVGMAIKKLANLFNRRLLELKENIEEPNSVTGLQGWIVGYLINHNNRQDVFQKDIEAEFNINRSSATALLQRMEHNGLIVREAITGDARWKKIILTKKAWKLRRRLEAVKEKMESRAIQNISKEELTAFFEVVKKLMKNLE